MARISKRSRLRRSPLIYPDDKCLDFSKTTDVCQTLKTIVVVELKVSVPLPYLDQVLINDPPILPISEVAFDYKGWIMGCLIYSEKGLCLLCYPPRYINATGIAQNDRCIKSPIELPFCSNYTLENEVVVCSGCYPGYYLKTGKCLLITAMNCATYKSESECDTCPNTFPVKKSKSCEIDFSNPWCYLYEKSTVEGQFLCTICQIGFYPNDDGICQVIHNPIRNCKYHQFESLCQICDPGYYLQYDGKKCLKNPKWDEFCDEFEYGYECSVCDLGYYIKNNTCKKCDVVDPGCAYCNPNIPNKCALCKFGFEMDSTAACKNNTAISEVQKINLGFRKWLAYPKDPGYDDQPTPAPASVENEYTTVKGLVLVKTKTTLIGLVLIFLFKRG